jgi:[ribosomal protein S5]-alanine N-acetyltransferase
VTAKDVRIRNLRHDDDAALLAFELANRAWFERHVEARDPDFYSIDGVRMHILGMLAEFAAGQCHPCLLVDEQDAIVGRANLKDIDRASGSAEVGYRIGEQHIGKGYATLALQQLIELARTRWKLRTLQALVIDGNAASAKVLFRCGFTMGRSIPAIAKVHGAPVDGHAYTLAIDHP